MQQNDENLRDQIGNYYNGDKAELMRQLGYQYLDDIDQLKVTLLEQNKQMFTDQLEKMKYQLQQNYVFMIQLKDQQIASLKKQMEQ